MHNFPLFATLFRKYLDNRCAPDEVDQLMAFLKEDAYKQYAEELIGQQAAAPKDNQRPVDMALRERLELRLQAILEPEADTVPVRRLHFIRRNRWWMAAAAVMLLLGAGAYMWLNRSTELPKAAIVQAKPETHLKNDVPPGGNKAVLTLANGKTIILDDAANGQLTQQGQTTVIKSGDGQLRYDAKALTIDHSPLTYNTLATPPGGQYQLVLPDGSKVWLNAASSIRYPTAFTGNERRVEITGEVYFEIEQLRNTAGRKIPFVVDITSPTRGGREGAVEVLGTHFNINAYDDEEAIKTTLLEGSVKVVNRESSMANARPDDPSGRGRYVIIKPGEQASLSHTSRSSHTIPVQTADIEEVMAWKNGAFQFGGADIQTVMRQISRWYNVEVEYKGNISVHFAGTMSRNLNISQVLQMLEKAAGVKTSVNGRKITVMP